MDYLNHFIVPVIVGLCLVVGYLIKHTTGADDYITKPFSLAILRARVNAQLRRGAAGKTACYTIDTFTFDFDRMEFRKAGLPIELSKSRPSCGSRKNTPRSSGSTNISADRLRSPLVAAAIPAPCRPIERFAGPSAFPIRSRCMTSDIPMCPTIICTTKRSRF